MSASRNAARLSPWLANATIREALLRKKEREGEENRIMINNL